MSEIDITKLPIIEYQEYKPRPESPEIEEVNSRFNQWMENQKASFWRDGQIPYIPRWMKIFLVNSSQMEDILHGRLAPVNIPDGAKLYDIRPWSADQICNVWGLWMVHPDFPEYISGTCVESEYVQL